MRFRIVGRFQNIMSGVRAELTREREWLIAGAQTCVIGPEKHLAGSIGMSSEGKHIAHPQARYCSMLACFATMALIASRISVASHGFCKQVIGLPAGSFSNG